VGTQWLDRQRRPEMPESLEYIGWWSARNGFTPRARPTESASARRFMRSRGDVPVYIREADMRRAFAEANDSGPPKEEAP
jgi:hypothetical protein